MRRSIPRVLAITAGCTATLVASQQTPKDEEGFRFKTGIELINVTATVTDRSGRFVPNLAQSDFIVYEDGVPVEVTHFSAERVPVSLGIVLDASGSMAGEKMEAARDAIDQFLARLIDRDDEVFLYAFDAGVELLHDWTMNRASVSHTLRQIRPRGGTAMYDAVAEAVPMAQTGRNRKKALVLISDGNDTNSRIDARDVRQVVRETEVLVYAIGIDGSSETTFVRPPAPRFPVPFPLPGGGGRGRPWPGPPPQYPPRGRATRGVDDRVNAAALRDITDDSGGRTEIVRDASDLDPATAGIADELSQQYYLGYRSQGYRDGRWHIIRVEVRDNPQYRVRARRGYIATP